MKKLLIVIVTHNSERFIEWAIEDLLRISISKTIRIVDSGSNNKTYLHKLKFNDNIEIIEQANVGFAKANNVALHDFEKFEFILFLNPDAKILAENLSHLLNHAANKKNNKTGIFSVPLVHYDILQHHPMETFDSLGIYCSFLGRWYDKTGLIEDHSTALVTYPDAVCGAFMLIRTHCLKECLNSEGNPGFEESYFMYKEDIELCLRVKKRGWNVEMYHDATAYHCRGWNRDRKETPPWARWFSAKNDLNVAIRYRWRALPFAALKYLWVKYVEKCKPRTDNN